MLVPTNGKTKTISMRSVIITFIRNFTAVPRIILSDQACSQTDKLVLGVINSLSYGKDYCYTSNGYLAKVLNVGTKTISMSLSNLRKLKYITIEYQHNKRKIYLNPNIVIQENSKVREKIFHDEVEKNFQYKRNNKKRNNNIKTINYDSDGVELWNGKRCEENLATSEEIEKFEKLLNS